MIANKTDFFKSVNYFVRVGDVIGLEMLCRTKFQGTCEKCCVELDPTWFNFVLCYKTQEGNVKAKVLALVYRNVQQERTKIPLSFWHIIAKMF